MSKSTLISVRVPVDVAQRLTALAEATDRSKSYPAALAIEEYLSIREWQLKAVEEGIREADAGELVDHERVIEWINSLGTDNEMESPK